MVSRRKSNNPLYLFIIPLFVFLFILAGNNASNAQGVDMCDGGVLNPDSSGGVQPKDLEVTNDCMVTEAGTYRYKNVNIYNGGRLEFKDANIDFWAKSILVEKDSSLIAGTTSAPIGNNGTLTIYLYGSKDDKAGIECKVTDPDCGIDVAINEMNTVNPSSCTPSTMPDGTTDCFYRYGVPDPVSGETGSFGSKVLAVSFGGTLQMYGVKGATIDDGSLGKSSSGTSWVRLAKDLTPSDATLTVNRTVNWQEGDHIVVTTTDYIPGHSEKLVITRKVSDTEFEYDVLDQYSNTIKVISDKVLYSHRGTTYPLNKVPSRVELDIKVDGHPAVETRAAVGLLTRSIRVVSAGDNVGQQFGPPTAGSFYGGHLMARQGVKSLQIQGVEFYQLGQGGRKGRYPVHMHLLRKSPNTFIKDNSIHDSMTRWVTLHGTQEITVARNVGFMSIGHGYYLEDGTEINNKLYSNLGVLARAAVDNDQNPRKVPGILAANANLMDGNLLTAYSDYTQPTVFWFTNGWNDFEYNMAAGATACGACYWPINAAISGPSKRQKWFSYASIKPVPSRDATAPIKKFKGNYCSTAMNSYNATVSTAPCTGVGFGGGPKIDFIPNPLAPAPPLDLVNDASTVNEFYYPIFSSNPNATRCDGDNTDCSKVSPCSGDDVNSCMVTVLDGYTTAFHWTETNFSAIWLRRAFFTVINSSITNVLNAGLTFVTGGDYTQSSLLPGSFMLAANNVFIGNTEEGNPFSSNAGPFSPGGLICGNTPAQANNYCVSIDEGISMPLSNFGMNQRLFNIYDGPANQASNAYLDITKTKLDCVPNSSGRCDNSEYMYSRVTGVPKDVKEVIQGNNVLREVQNSCILPNAAIAWKQSNGFYYPPAFHSDNLFFDNTEIRHFVIQPLFIPGTFNTDFPAVQENYCVNNPGLFTGWTAIDRQTILNDDDGSLTGVEKTISVNEDPFFTAPIEQFECRSDATVKTSPYEYVSTVVYPGCFDKKDCGGTCSRDGQPCAETSNCTPAMEGEPNLCQNSKWTANCTSGCYGVPLIRQYLTGTENTDADTEIRMQGPAIRGRINLTSNNGLYYIDTTRNQAQSSFPLKNIFMPNDDYYTFFVFAKPEIKQTYQYYVGIDPSIDENDPQIVQAVTANIATLNVVFGEVPGGWVATGWDRKYDSSTGILSVTVDMENFRSNFDQAKVDSCKPSSFCTHDGNKCGCSDQLKIDDPDLYTECQRIDICRWSGNDPDCPIINGRPLCLGFEISMPSTFIADDQDRRPTPIPFPKDANWNVPWPKVGPSIAGQECYKFPTPDSNFADGGSGSVSNTRNIIEGTDGDDVLQGTMGPDLILGFGGDDEIDGRGGDDIIDGGPGDDTLDGGMGDDTIVGGEGNDLIMGGKGHDNIDAGDGDDFVQAGAGNDDVSGGDGNDVLIGQSGNDEIDGNAGDDMIEGKQGADDIDGGSGDDMIMGGSGGDNILGGSGNDMIEGGGGPDTCAEGESGSVCENEL